MAGEENQPSGLIVEQIIDIEPETSEISNNNIPEETILEKLLASDNLVEEVKKWLVDLKQEIWEKVDIVQDKAWEIYDKVSNEVTETIKPINDVVAENIEKAEKELEEIKQEIWKTVDVVQDKSVKIKNSVKDWAVDIYKTTTNYWWEKANSVQKYISDYWNIRWNTKNHLVDLKQGIPTIGPEWKIPKKNRLVLDEYKQKENRKIPEENARKFLQMDVKDSALDILDGTYRPIWYKDKKVIEFFDKIPLEKVFEAHNKATSYNDFQDTFETYWEITKAISKQYIGSEMENLRWIGIKKISLEMKEKLIEKSKLRTRELMKIIGYFLRKEKWWEFENIANNKKKYPNIWALLENKEFKKFIESEKSLFNKDVWFTEFKTKQVEWLIGKLATTQNQDLASPWLTFDVPFGDTITQKNISLRWENTVDGVENKDSKKSLYIMWYKYKFDWIRDIESIKIDWYNFVIKW